MKTVTNNTVDRLRFKSQLLKTIAAVCGLLLMLPSAWAQFSWPLYEPFGEYTNGTGLGTDLSSNYWNFGNGGAHDYWVVTNAAAMSWPGLVPETNAEPKGVQEIPENTTSADRGCMFSPQTNTTVYASFLLNYQDNGGASDNRCIFNLVTGVSDNGSFTHIFTSVWLTPDYRIVIDKNVDSGGAFSDPTPVLATNVPHLIVLRYLRVPGGDDEVDLWVDPAPLGNDSIIPPPTISTTDGANISSFNGFLLEQRKTPSYQLNLFQVDEIRLGDTWGYVTAPTPPPGPLFGVTGGGTGCAGDIISVGVSGSVDTNLYLLYVNGVYSGQSQSGTGSALDFGPQTVAGTYTVLASNTITADVGWMTNSVFLKVRRPPVIVTEPNPVVTATNNRAEFTVDCTGDALGYQWYREGGTALSDDSHITGSTTNDLVIWPATASDVGGYYCVITNVCGAITNTATVSLILDAPNDLVWAGDAFGVNIWAVGTTSTPEFTDASANPAYFNGGDNVTFDDSYNGSSYGTNITLDGVLTPTVIRYSTGQELSWVGDGFIAGSGMLQVDGSGVLDLNNNQAGGYENTYSGGTVISNGTVNIHNSWNSLGTGPVTLAGGTLETYQKGNGSSTGLPGALYVTADSTWQVDRSGDQCAGTLGGLFGSPGTTLTLTNSWVQDNKENRIRLAGVFTNYSAIVVFGDAVNSNSWMDVGSYTGFNDDTGIQVYNGPISGDTGFLVVGLGRTYLNGANTYTHDTTTYAGLLAGSGSIDGNLVVNSGTALGGGSEDAIGTFTVHSNLTLNGDVFVRVDKSLSPAQTNDMIVVTGAITNTGTGTMTITNIGATPLAVGDRFQIFSGPVQNGDALTVTGAGMAWINNLAVDGSVQVSPVITASPTITSFGLDGANVVLSGNNGQAATAYLLMTTNVAEPPSLWKTVATNVLGGDAYTFIGTNVVTAGSPQQFFMLSSTNYNP